MNLVFTAAKDWVDNRAYQPVPILGRIHMRWLCLVLLAAISYTVPAGAQNVRISEFMPNNDRTLADEDGEFPDWIEIHNPETSPVNLAGWHLTDNPLVLTKWAFPSVTVPANGYLVVFASGKNRTATPPLHTSFQLNTDGGFLALVKPDGTSLASVFPAYPSVKEDVAFGVAVNTVT